MGRLKLKSTQGQKYLKKIQGSLTPFGNPFLTWGIEK